MAQRRVMPKGQFVEYPNGRLNTLCSIDGCEKTVLARGWCWLHYDRWKKSGDPLLTRKKKRALSRPPCPVVEFGRPCGRPFEAHGLCRMHNARLRETGSVFNQKRRRGTLAERFWDSVERHRDEECWPWLGRLDAERYGIIDYQKRPHLAHRVSWYLHHGAWPDEGLTIDHECHNADMTCPGRFQCAHRQCVNPFHLSQKPLNENVRAARIPERKRGGVLRA